jgi:hypothetical protein
MSSYLTLKECLTLASSSRRCLLDIIPVLEQRRARMVQPYAITMIVRGSESQYQLPPSPTSSMDSSCLLVEEKDEVKRTKQKNEEEITFGLLATLRREYDDLLHVVHVFPTLQDRIGALLKRLPSQYRLKSVVQELHKSLLLPMPRSRSVSTNLVDQLSTTVRPLKLYESVLGQILAADNGNEAKKCIDLHQYIGDVLCLTYLWHDCTTNCSFAEGSGKRLLPTQTKTTTTSATTTKSMYQSWILLHSSILRSQTFSGTERARLGIPNFVAAAPGTENNKIKNATVTNMIERYNRQLWAQPVIPLDVIRTSAFMNSTLTVVYDDFGPLGPSFRGRDVVRMCEVTAHCFLAAMSASMQARATAFEWMAVAHETAVQTRPVSVRAPLVRLS